MAIRMKKLLAILTAAITIAASVPTAYLLAASADGDTTEDSTEITEASDTTDTSDVSDTSETEEEEIEEGETVQEGALGEVAEEEWITIDDYELVAESDTYYMYYYEDRLSIILENKETGAYMYSTLMDADDDGLSNSVWNGYMKSGIVCTVLANATSTLQIDLINYANTITTKYTDNGLAAEVYYDDYGVGFTVEITLDGDNLTVTIPDDSIVEESDTNYIGTISVFPMMGYTHMGEQNGYIFIPDGNGALIYLDNKEGRYSSGYDQMVYGSDDGFADSSAGAALLWDKYEIVNDSYQVMAPIFGMAHLDDQLAYLAIITEGDTRASIVADPNGASVNYNRCFARFVLRVIYTQPLNNSNSGTVQQVEADHPHNDLEVTYVLLSGDDANYSGMANAYREYLLDNNLVSKQNTTYNTRVDFLGTDREEFLMGTKAVTVTTVDDIYDMYADLKSAGVESLITVYKGWQKGGIYSIPISKYKADSHIGGTSALTTLIKEAAQDQYHIYLYNDALEVNVSTNSSTYGVVKMVNKRTLTIETHKQVYDEFYYQLPSKSESSLEKFVSSYTKKGVNNLAVAGISNTLFSYYSKSNYYSRVDTAKIYEETLESISEDTNLILEQPSAYLWKYTQAILDMPLGTSDFMYEDEEIPFLSMVLKGIVPMYSEYVNFEANKSEFFLQMVESGVYPSFYLTAENSSALIYTNSNDLYSTEFSNYKDTVAEYDLELRNIAEKVYGATIIKHEILQDGVRRVTYDNGVAIYVNYTEEDVTVDGVTVGAMSYKVGDAE